MSDLSKQNLAVHGGSINNEDNQQKNQEKKLPRESFEEFCKRLGIKLVRVEKGGQEFAPFHGGNLSHKKPLPEQHKDRST
jgi:hypothetical protein